MSRSATATRATDTSVTNGKLSLGLDPRYIEGNSLASNGNGLEMSVLQNTSHRVTAYKDVNSTSRNGEEPAPSAVTASMKRNDRLYLAVLSWSLFVVGWNDGTLGPFLGVGPDVHMRTFSLSFYLGFKSIIM
ncbi:hypothetical protein FRC02_010233 [Tulasnella sp. 418]|nr:hypothetical protein FRC02_010233 [Tulasnella sp. 418]